MLRTVKGLVETRDNKCVVVGGENRALLGMFWRVQVVPRPRQVDEPLREQANVIKHNVELSLKPTSSSHRLAASSVTYPEED